MIETYKSKICVMVLASGLPVFGRIIEDDLKLGIVVVESPMKISTHLIPTANGPQLQGIPEALNPFDPKAVLTLTRSQYLYLNEAPSDIEKTWLQATSGIVLGN